MVRNRKLLGTPQLASRANLLLDTPSRFASKLILLQDTLWGPCPKYVLHEVHNKLDLTVIEGPFCLCFEVCEFEIAGRAGAGLAPIACRGFRLS